MLSPIPRHLLRLSMSDVMDPACLRHTEIPGTSKLFADLSYDFDTRSRALFPAQSAPPGIVRRGGA